MEILRQYKAGTEVLVDDLLSKGFDFNFQTCRAVTDEGYVSTFCYTYGFIFTDNDKKKVSIKIYDTKNKA